jgi:hypothetical protein
MVKKRLGKKDFYLRVLNEFKIDTNLTRIQKSLNLSKQNLNYYIARLCKLGFLENRGIGWYEVKKSSKKTTKYGMKLSEDLTRGHAFIWTTPLENIPPSWSDRISILEKKKINFKLCGALKTTPRIKILGRKVWLCNNHLRIFDKEKASYYGNTAKESRANGFITALKIIRVLENKLGFRLNPNKITFVKEHYALIKNKLAIHHNENNIIMRVSDDEGEWLLIDDSLEKGGEIETTGKNAFKTHPLVKEWWNDHKKTNFQVTSSFILETLYKQSKIIDDLLLTTKNQVEFNKQGQELQRDNMLIMRSLMNEVIELKKR